MASIQSIGVNFENNNVGDAKEAQFQKDKEEKIRAFREHQEEERLKKLRVLEEQFMNAKKHREQQDEIRRRRIEEARAKEIERRHQVEERKRQIWEAEQERKEAILRRNMEREMRIEARRNAQRNSQSFAFGSSTPRTFDLDLAAIGVGRNLNQGSLLMSSVSGRRSEERDIGPPRATSACSLDRKIGDNCMSRSMVSLSSTFRGRKKTDLMPTFTRERSTTPHITPRGNQSMRAVSMTRLDQLAQPRRIYPRNHISVSPTSVGPRTTSPSMSKSMCNLANSHMKSKRTVPACSNGMSQSMLHLADTQKEKHTLNSPPKQPKSNMRSAQSMMHLTPTPPPRLTRAARLRAKALASNHAVSAWNVSKSDSHYLSSDTSRSPSRPQSSMSGTSEISATSSSVSGVNMRVRPMHRKPRPFSIAGCISDRSTAAKKEPEHKPRLEKHDSAPIHKLNRTRSVEKVQRNVLPQKPIPPPKSSEVLARAKSQPVHTKDNLRKVTKVSASKSTEESKFSGENKEKLISKSTEETADIDKKNETTSSSEMEKNPSLVSLTTGLEASLICEDSKANVVVEVNNDALSQTAANDQIKVVNDCATLNAAILSEQTIEKNDNVENVLDKNVQKPVENAIDKNVQKPLKSVLDKDVQKPVENVLDKNVQKPVENVLDKNVQKPVENVLDKNIQKPAALPSDNSDSEPVNKETTTKYRITSEEEAKIALAEKRRLAREQAEREAELERQRLEEIRRQEEEKRRLEEEEMKRIEEEQIRLAELHAKLEEEKLQKAIQEREQREREEQERRNEEARQKAEREEQEKKAREEAERQRIELEEKLRKEEEERAERKRRVEQIMARTRGKTIQSPSDSSNERNTKQTKTDEKSNVSTLEKVNIIISSIGGSQSSISSSEKVQTVTENGTNHISNTWSSDMKPLPDLLNSENIANLSTKANGQYVESTNFLSEVCISSDFPVLSTNNVETSLHSNGYSSHEEMSCTTSPEENTEFLVDIQSCQQKTSTDFTKLVDLESPSMGVNNQNFLIDVDDINSNLLNATNSFDDSLQNKQNSQITDLLS